MQTRSPSWAVVLLGSRPFSQFTMLLLRNSGSKSIQRRRKWCASVQIMISLLMISDSKNVERFKYLGSYVNRNCNLNAEITARIQAASNSYYSLKLQVFDNRDLTENTKISVYKQCILSIFLYWSETWTLYSDEIKQLCTVQQRHLQSILKISWNTFVSNETVLSSSNVEDIETLLAQIHLRWIGHLCHMENTRTLRKLFYGELAEGSRPVGRLKLRFKDDLKSILKSRIIPTTWGISV